MTINANDFDVDDEPLYYSALNGPFNGTLALDTNGTYVYTPNLNFVGTDMATYMVCDSCNACAVSNLFITINFLNNPPIAEDDYFSMGKNTILSGNLAGNDSDIQNDPLTYALVNSTPNGSFLLQPDGSFVFTPNLQYFGSVVLTYSVCDSNNACTQATITIEVLNVNSPPVFTAPIVMSCEGIPTEIQLEDCVEDAETSWSEISFQNVESSSGVVYIDENGNLIFEPEVGYTGPVTITFETCDNDPGFPICIESVINFTVNAPVGVVQLTDTFVSDVLCFGESGGSILLFAEPVSANVFQWSTGENTTHLENLTAGTYMVTISSSLVCLQPLETTFEITQPESALSIVGLDALPINENPGGSSTYEVIGGTEPYNFSWTDSNNMEVAQSQMLSGLNQANLAGSYTVTITDANECQISQTINVTQIIETEPGLEVSIYPNPSNGIFNFEWNAFFNGQVQIRLYDNAGRVIRDRQESSGSGRALIDLSGEPAGFYSFTLIHTESVIRGVVILK